MISIFFPLNIPEKRIVLFSTKCVVFKISLRTGKPISAIPESYWSDHVCFVLNSHYYDAYLCLMYLDSSRPIKPILVCQYVERVWKLHIWSRTKQFSSLLYLEEKKLKSFFITIFYNCRVCFTFFFFLKFSFHNN